MMRALHQDHTPHEDVEGEVVCGWRALHEEVGRNCPDEPSEVEDTSGAFIVRARSVFET